LSSRKVLDEFATGRKPIPAQRCAKLSDELISLNLIDTTMKATCVTQPIGAAPPPTPHSSLEFPHQRRRVGRQESHARWSARSHSDAQVKESG